jgi:hypothetical protein
VGGIGIRDQGSGSWGFQKSGRREGGRGQINQGARDFWDQEGNDQSIDPYKIRGQGTN